MANYNYYYDSAISAHVEARYVDGKFVELRSNEPLELQEGAVVRIVTPMIYLPEKLKELYKGESRKVLDAGEELYFELPKTDWIFHLRLLEDLYLKKINNKPAVSDYCPCEVWKAIHKVKHYPMPGFEPWQTGTLNQAFFRASVKYRPESRSHVTNIYKAFRVRGTGETLESLRY